MQGRASLLSSPVRCSPASWFRSAAASGQTLDQQSHPDTNVQRPTSNVQRRRYTHPPTPAPGDGHLALQELHNQIRAAGADQQQQHLVDVEHTEDPTPRPGVGLQQLHRHAGLTGNAAGGQPRARAHHQHLVMATSLGNGTLVQQ